MEKGGKNEDVAELLFHSIVFFFVLSKINTDAYTIHTRFLGVYSFVSKFMSQWHVTRIFMENLVVFRGKEEKKISL